MASQRTPETYLPTFSFSDLIYHIISTFIYKLRAFLLVIHLLQRPVFFYRTGRGRWSISCAALSDDHVQSEAWGGVVTYLRPGDAAARLLDGSLRLVRLADGPDMMTTDTTVSS
jgi:hypothetical protein